MRFTNLLGFSKRYIEVIILSFHTWWWLTAALGQTDGSEAASLCHRLFTTDQSHTQNFHTGHWVNCLAQGHKDKSEHAGAGIGTADLQVIGRPALPSAPPVWTFPKRRLCFCVKWRRMREGNSLRSWRRLDEPLLRTSWNTAVHLVSETEAHTVLSTLYWNWRQWLLCLFIIELC